MENSIRISCWIVGSDDLGDAALSAAIEAVATANGTVHKTNPNVNLSGEFLIKPFTFLPDIWEDELIYRFGKNCIFINIVGRSDTNLIFDNSEREAYDILANFLKRWRNVSVFPIINCFLMGDNSQILVPDYVDALNMNGGISIGFKNSKDLKAQLSKQILVLFNREQSVFNMDEQLSDKDIQDKKNFSNYIVSRDTSGLPTENAADIAEKEDLHWFSRKSFSPTARIILQYAASFLKASRRDIFIIDDVAMLASYLAMALSKEVRGLTQYMTDYIRGKTPTEDFIVQFLELSGYTIEYGIDGFPAEPEHFPSSRDFSWDQIDVLKNAYAFAQKTSDDKQIHARHILAAIVCQHASKELLSLLSRLGRNVVDIRKKLIEIVSQYTHEPEDEWIRFLFEDPAIVKIPKRTKDNGLDWQSDVPSCNDMLFREPLASILAERFNQIMRNEKQMFKKEHNKSGNKECPRLFMVNLHAPWGAGKTTLIRFIKEKLNPHGTRFLPNIIYGFLLFKLCQAQIFIFQIKGQSNGNTGARFKDYAKELIEFKVKHFDKRWIVIDFNAWQHQHIGPPWWSLMNSVYIQGRQQISLSRRLYITFKHFFWNLKLKSLIPYFAIFLVVTLAGSFYFYLIEVSNLISNINDPLDPGKAKEFLNSTADIRRLREQIDFNKYIGFLSKPINIFKSFAFFGTLSSLPIINSLRKFASAKAAQSYMANAKDNMKPFSNHYVSIVNGMNRPVAMFIDDLDRCKRKYVIDLLEGIQTVFKSAPVLYVVSSDRRWLCSCYKKEYNDFSEDVKEPGRPLEYLFLEKIFQLSIEIPEMPRTIRESYWRKLIKNRENNSEDKHDEVNINKMISMAAEEFTNLKTPQQIKTAIMSAHEDTNPIYADIRLATAVKRLSDTDISNQTEHALAKFHSLLESNPRSMKRFINDYNIQESIVMLNRIELDENTLALWIILKLRWPILASYLSRNPEAVNAFFDSSKDFDIQDKNLKLLFTDKEVRKVIEGGGLGAKLNQEIINRYSVSMPLRG